MVPYNLKLVRYGQRTISVGLNIYNFTNFSPSLGFPHEISWTNGHTSWWYNYNHVTVNQYGSLTLPFSPFRSSKTPNELKDAKIGIRLLKRFELSGFLMKFG